MRIPLHIKIAIRYVVICHPVRIVYSLQLQKVSVYLSLPNHHFRLHLQHYLSVNLVDLPNNKVLLYESLVFFDVHPLPVFVLVLFHHLAQCFYLS